MFLWLWKHFLYFLCKLFAQFKNFLSDCFWSQLLNSVLWDNSISVINILSLKTLSSYLPQNDFYIFSWLPQPNRQVPRTPKTFANCCVASICQQGSSSSEGNLWRLWILQSNELLSFSCTTPQTFLTSIKWTNWL